MPPITRSRNGCANCKRRKRKCDEGRPACGPCEQRGIRCEGYAKPLRWVVDTISQDQSAHIADSPSTDVQSHLELSGSQDPVSRPTASKSLQASGHGSLSTAHTSNDVFATGHELFEKFLTSGLCKLYNSETQSWIRTIFEEMATKSQALIIICIAIQGYVDDGCDRMSVSSMERLDLALRTFRAELSGQSGDITASTACAGVLICSLCLLQARPFTMYVKLMADLYSLEAKMPLLEPGLRHDLPTLHILECMCAMDLPGYVLGRVSPSIGLWKRFRKAQDSWIRGRLNGVEVGTGMPRSLLDIFADVLDDDLTTFESRLWLWPGELGEYIQCHLWDCWRFSGILAARRRMLPGMNYVANATDKTEGWPKAPDSELIMCRLIASMDAIRRHFQFYPDADQYALIQNGLVFPLTTASLEVQLLKAHPRWKQTLDGFREHLTKRDTFNFIQVLFKLLDEAWSGGTSDFDINGAAHKNGVEIVLF